MLSFERGAVYLGEPHLHGRHELVEGMEEDLHEGEDAYEEGHDGQEPSKAPEIGPEPPGLGLLDVPGSDWISRFHGSILFRNRGVLASPLPEGGLPYGRRAGRSARFTMSVSCGARERSG